MKKESKMFYSIPLINVRNAERNHGSITIPEDGVESNPEAYVKAVTRSSLSKSSQMNVQSVKETSIRQHVLKNGFLRAMGLVV